jgi:protein TonB
MTRLAVSISLALHTACALVLAARPPWRAPAGAAGTIPGEQVPLAFMSPESAGEVGAPPSAQAARPLPPLPELAPPFPDPDAAIDLPMAPVPTPAALTSTLAGVRMMAAPADGATRLGTRRKGLERKMGDSSTRTRGVAGPKGAGNQSATAFDLPQFSFHPPPPYPAEARARHWEGVAQLLLSVDATGKVSSAQLLRSSGYLVLDRAALEIAHQWRFIPARQDGLPTASRVAVPVRFRYGNKSA